MARKAKDKTAKPKRATAAQVEADEPIKLGKGRPSLYKPEYVKQAAKLCFLGATDADLADFFEVSLRTIDNWKAQYKEFSEALRPGKNEADERVERSLYQKAIGYEYDAVKVFNANGKAMVVPYREKCPPDTTAAMFWLKNRRAEQWRDVQKHEHGGPGDFSRMSDDELQEFIAAEVPNLVEADFRKTGKTQH